MIIIISTGTEKGQNFYSCDLKGFIFTSAQFIYKNWFIWIYVMNKNIRLPSDVS